MLQEMAAGEMGCKRAQIVRKRGNWAKFCAAAALSPPPLARSPISRYTGKWRAESVTAGGGTEVRRLQLCIKPNSEPHLSM